MTSEFFYDSGFDNCFQDAPFGQSVVSDWFRQVSVYVQTPRSNGYIDFDGANLLARAIRARANKYGMALSDTEEALLFCLIDEPPSKEDDGIHPSDS